jgi:hypothetical protein
MRYREMACRLEANGHAICPARLQVDAHLAALLPEAAIYGWKAEARVLHGKLIGLRWEIPYHRQPGKIAGALE